MKMNGRAAAASMAAVAFLAGCREDNPMAPAGAKIELIANPTTVAPAVGTSHLTMIVTDDDDPVSAGTRIFLSASGGGIVPDSVETDGDGVAEATFRAGSQAGSSTVTARSGSVSDTVDIAINEGNLGTLSLTGTPLSLNPWGEEDSVHLTVTYTRPLNQDPSSVTVILESSNGLGSFEPTTFVAAHNSPVAAEYRRTLGVTGVDQISAKAIFEGGTLTANQSLSVTIVDQLTDFSATASPSQIPSTATVATVILSSETIGTAGHVIAGQEVRFEITAGKFGNNLSSISGESNAEGKVSASFSLTSAELTALRDADAKVEVTVTAVDSNLLAKKFSVPVE